MYPIIAHIYGPFAINGYGTAILSGVLIFLWLTYYNKNRIALLSDDQLNSFISINLLGAVIGGRLLYIISDWKSFSHWTEFLELWDGGFSILGTLLGVIGSSTVFLTMNHIPLFPVCDLMALNVAIIQAFGRFGCFLSGCCYGFITHQWYGITFTNPEGLAPLCISLMPSQLISAGSFLLIFGLMHLLKPWCTKHGQLTFLYIIFTSIERFMNDFLRGERTLYTHFFTFYLSLHQYIAAFIIFFSFLGFIFVAFNRKKS